MAKIISENIVITFSKIVKDTDSNLDSLGITSSEIKQALEQVAQELVGDSIIVEVVE